MNTHVATILPPLRVLQALHVLMQTKQVVYLLLCLHVIGLRLKYHGLQLLNLLHQHLCLVVSVR